MPNTGKAFEYACLLGLQQLLNGLEVQITHNQALVVARNAYNEQSEASRDEMALAANAGFRVIIRYEPQLLNPMENTPLYLSIQEDSQGIAGDVRDLLCIRQQNRWEIGISCKHNHDAVKHSRLSKNIDFGEKWFNRACSQQYFADIAPLFVWLQELKNQRVKWRDVQDKHTGVYRPLLIAFINEMNRLYEEHGEVVPQGLLNYLIGWHDFYKLIDRSKRRNTRVQAFNLHGTLNRNAGNNRVNNLPRTLLPNRIHDIDFKPQSDNTILIVCDNGWSFSLRIHSARTLVETSLKFDAQLLGVPPGLFMHDEHW